EVQRAEGELGSHLEHDASLVVGEPDLGASTLGKNAVGLDDRLNDDGVVFSRRHAYVFASKDANRHRVSLGTKIAIELVGLANLGRHRADEVEKGAVVQRFGDGWRLGVFPLGEHAALGKDLESTFALAAALAQ